MSRLLKRLILCWVFICCASYPETTVCFTPNKQCQQHIISEIMNAKESIRVQAYGFTDKLIAHALVNMYTRGVDVAVILDKSNRTSVKSVRSILIDSNIPLRFDLDHGIAHNKIMIIDESRVITGSYNFSENAYKVNRENVLIIEDKELSKKYLDNWNDRWERSE